MNYLSKVLGINVSYERSGFESLSKFYMYEILFTDSIVRMSKSRFSLS